MDQLLDAILRATNVGAIVSFKKIGEIISIRLERSVDARTLRRIDAKVSPNPHISEEEKISHAILKALKEL